MEKISGIYIIENTLDGKVYVGSSVNIRRRFKEHKRRLDQGIQPNKHLQAAWTKYGDDNFKFEVVEKIPNRLLAERETYWINAYDSLDDRYGYNLAINTSCPWSGPQSRAFKKVHQEGVDNYLKNVKADYIKSKIIDPGGLVHSIECIPEFCKKHKLTCKSIYAVLSKDKVYKGWRKFDKERVGKVYDKAANAAHGVQQRWKRYTVISPTGEVVNIYGLTDFCRLNKLSQANMNQVVNGKSNYAHKGWRRFDKAEVGKIYDKVARHRSQQMKKDYIFVSPNGIITKVHGLAAFCRLNGLGRGNMAALHAGRHKQSKGWTKYVGEEIAV